MTERLYYEQTTLKTFTATIVEQRDAERGVLVRLDKTAFYPTSGGQPYDTGTLAGKPVLDVWVGEDQEVWHLLKETPGTQEVTGEINWARRFDHMQQHTGQHLLSAACVELLDAATTSFHLGETYSTIDLDIPGLDEKDTQEVENKVNGIIWEDRPVTTRFVSPDELKQIPLRKPPKVEENVRIVWITGCDASACGGTHVASTGQIGMLKITNVENYKGGVRVTFLCGQRALSDYQRIQHIVQTTGNSLSVGQDDIYETVQRTQDEVKATRRELRQAQEQLNALETAQLWDTAPEQNGTRYITKHWEQKSFQEVRAIAAQLREHPRALILLATTEEKGVRIVCARSDDLPEINARVVLQAALDPLNGRGGGPPTLAQGGAPLASEEEILAALKQAVLIREA
ncbi:MAG: hypothetical protein JW981_07740 [Anaerolineae bacterium]|nr:hypothetical protein [Anaerolineae bacterium]